MARSTILSNIPRPRERCSASLWHLGQVIRVPLPIEIPIENSPASIEPLSWPVDNRRGGPGVRADQRLNAHFLPDGADHYNWALRNCN
jgi:hypothetical protein